MANRFFILRLAAAAAVVVVTAAAFFLFWCGRRSARICLLNFSYCICCWYFSCCYLSDHCLRAVARSCCKQILSVFLLVRIRVENMRPSHRPKSWCRTERDARQRRRRRKIQNNNRRGAECRLECMCFETGNGEWMESTGHRRHECWMHVSLADFIPRWLHDTVRVSSEICARVHLHFLASWLMQYDATQHIYGI